MIAAILAAALLPRATPSQAEETVERILAVVDQRPILLSEVRLVQKLRQLDEAAALTMLIDEVLMFQEAWRFPQARGTAAEEEKACASLRNQISDLAIPDAALARVARRQTSILKYIDFRFRPLTRVSEEDVQQAYAREYGQQPAAPPLADVQLALRRRLETRALNLKIEEWVRELRASAQIRFNLAPTPAADRPR